MIASSAFSWDQIKDWLGNKGITIVLVCVGAFVVVLLENYLSGFQGLVSVVEGVVFVVCVLVFRQGIMGKLGELLKTPL